MPSGSRLVAGSSSSTSGGSWRKVRASRSRCRCPVESRSARRAASDSSPNECRLCSTASRRCDRRTNAIAAPEREMVTHRVACIEPTLPGLQEPDASLVFASRGPWREARHRHSARVRHDQPGDDSEERRLPDPVRADERYHGPGADVEVDRVENGARAVSPALRDAAKDEQRRLRGLSERWTVRRLRLRNPMRGHARVPLTSSPAQPGACSPDNMRIPSPRR